MFLNTLQPGPGSHKPAKRLGRGIGSGKGKTCGKGHKGQKARAGGYHHGASEGGQMPLVRRLPKFGFTSPVAPTRAEVRLQDLNRLNDETIDMEALAAAGLIKRGVTKVKIILQGQLTKAVVLQGLHATQGARRAIEAAGGRIEP